ncbi:phospho-N-acetylmuramoyl-pentapeptide-transferase [Phototrophicus methaneseepsis]|uniref:Phospho-N-acetylmuramoyl-pentapeptide-transferase n=1 Tax=Phototrophicus methaneseepsis TaxID=2710758 RepID=A0A7S8ICV4_9CHLR|nr:phospho-N-acetylmuramoyl-pentapeptide-transferase [Phototrophicus methaneseepsis]QPC81930.1 phospho-N-acetylmuramoyl-pentapeptide-transferase [Phototrophicus methaneseepsis]
MGTQLPLALTVGGMTFLLGVIWGGPFVEILRRLKIGKQIRIELQDSHGHKVGTPTMGGIMIIVPTVIIVLALSLARIVQDGQGASVFLPLAVLIGFSLLGLIDDWEGIQTSRGIHGEGLSGRIKFLAQLVLAGAAAVMLSLYQGGFALANQILIPLIPVSIPLSPVIFIPMTMFIIVGMSNAVNLTDGMDGLAGIICASAFAAYGVIAFLQGQIFVVQLCFILVGACFAFLWFNAHPAQLFMGDAGSLPLGATLGIVAVMTGQWALLPIVAIVPVMETVSVMIQVASAKLTRRYLGQDIRPFRRTPLHHHFELVGWSETQVVQRFWLVGILSAMIGVALALI